VFQPLAKIPEFPNQQQHSLAGSSLSQLRSSHIIEIPDFPINSNNNSLTNSDLSISPVTYLCTSYNQFVDNGDSHGDQGT
jgi:hypothetical protein